MKVPFADLHIEDPDILGVAASVLASGRFIGGSQVTNFEEAWAYECHAAHCVSVASGSAALTTALKAVHNACGVANTFVVVPAISFAATAFSVLEAGLRPIYVDVDIHGLMDMDLAAKALKSVGAVHSLPVHLYGQVMDLSRMYTWQNAMVEDACQAHGGLERVQGVAACFSFYPSKNLGACGDAGAVVTDWPGIDEFVRMYTNYGDKPGTKYNHSIVGTNARMDAIQAAILHGKLCKNYMSDSNNMRAGVAKEYASQGITSFAQEPCVWHQYPIYADDPDAFCAAMKARDIDTGRHYPYTLPDVVDGIIYADLPNARFLAQHAVSLPMGPHLTTDMVQHVVDSVHNVAWCNECGLWVMR